MFYFSGRGGSCRRIVCEGGECEWDIEELIIFWFSVVEGCCKVYCCSCEWGRFKLLGYMWGFLIRIGLDFYVLL